jgi:hypothetical protein
MNLTSGCNSASPFALAAFRVLLTVARLHRKAELISRWDMPASDSLTISTCLLNTASNRETRRPP